MTWGFPCLDLSLSNAKGKGLQGKRSGLYYEGLRILRHVKPKYSIIENVDGLLSKKHIHSFHSILKDLEAEGYTNYYKVLNAIDYGIPQHRNRVYIVSIRNDIKHEFKFPEPQVLDDWFMNFLEDSISVKYYLSHKEREYMNRETKDGRNHWDFKHYHDTDEQYCHCLTANLFKGVPYNVLVDRRKCWLYDCDFIDQDYESFCKECCGYDCFQETNIPTSGIRKLTPLEVTRLMGFDDNDYKILKANKISNMQIYKMMGNSIVVPVLEGIFKGVEF